MNAGTDHFSTLAHDAEGLWHQCAHRGIDDGRIERDWWAIFRGSDPARAERARQCLRFPIALASERVDGTSLPICDLRHDVSGRAKAKDAEVLRVTRHDQ